MADTLEVELLRILQAITFPAPGVVRLASYIPFQAPAVGQVPGGMATADPLVAQLQQLLYDRCYCHRFGSATPHVKSAPTIDTEFLPSLSAANASRERWDSGWRIQQTLPSGQNAVVKGGTTRMVWPGEFHAHGGPGLPATPGTEVSLFVAKESRTMQPGFYFVFGEALGDQEEEMSLVRFYWHVTVPGAAPLVSALTQALNRFSIPFRFKCLAMPALYERADSAILYVAKRYYDIAADLLAEPYQQTRQFLDATTPLFSKRLAHGLGFAESPKSGESFGMHRCRIVAEAVCNAHARGIEAAEDLLKEVASSFAAAGFALDRPFLNPGSVDRYNFNNSSAQ